MEPFRCLPDYGGRCLTSLLGVLQAKRTASDAPLGDVTKRIRGSRGIVLVVLDGLGAQQLSVRAELAPTLSHAQLEPMTSVAPSTTATALTSLTTGAVPGIHGIAGYRILVGDDVLQTLRWTVEGSDAASRFPPESIQPITPQLHLDGAPVPYVAKELFRTSRFTRAHLRGCRYLGSDDPPSMVATAVTAAMESRFVMVYHDGIDKTAHHTGLGDAYDAAIMEAEMMVADLRRQLPDDVAVVVTSDHGQVAGGPSELSLGQAGLAHVAFMSGEGRFRWLHAHPGEAHDLLDHVQNDLGDSAWLFSKRQAIAEGLFGDIDDVVSDRLGDVAVLPHGNDFMADPKEPKESRMKSRHGSLTEAEMLIPLIVL